MRIRNRSARFHARLLSSLLILSIAWPCPAFALRPLNAGAEESRVADDLRSRLLEGEPSPAAGPSAPPAAGLEEKGKAAQALPDLIRSVHAVLETEGLRGAGRLKPRIEQIQAGELFTEHHVTYLPATQGRLKVIGDLRGDLEALERALAQAWYDPLRNARLPPEQRIHLVFVGDYADVGASSVEVAARVLLLKAMDPQHVVLLGGSHDRDRLHGEFQRLMMDLPVLAVFPNGIVIGHAAGPSLADPPAQYPEPFRARFDPALGLLNFANPLIVDQLGWNPVRRPAPGQPEPEEDQIVDGAEYPRIDPSTMQPGYWIGWKSHIGFLKAVGGRVFLRGHDRLGPPDEALFGGTFLTVITTDYRSPHHGYDPKERIIGRYAEFDLARVYEKIDPDEAVRYLIWPRAGSKAAYYADLLRHSAGVIPYPLAEGREGYLFYTVDRRVKLLVSEDQISVTLGSPRHGDALSLREVRDGKGGSRSLFINSVKRGARPGPLGLPGELEIASWQAKDPSSPMVREVSYDPVKYLLTLTLGPLDLSVSPGGQARFEIFADPMQEEPIGSPVKIGVVIRAESAEPPEAPAGGAAAGAAEAGLKQTLEELGRAAQAKDRAAMSRILLAEEAIRSPQLRILHSAALAIAAAPGSERWDEEALLRFALLLVIRNDSGLTRFAQLEPEEFARVLAGASTEDDRLPKELLQRARGRMASVLGASIPAPVPPGLLRNAMAGKQGALENLAAVGTLAVVRLAESVGVTLLTGFQLGVENTASMAAHALQESSGRLWNSGAFCRALSLQEKTRGMAWGQHAQELAAHFERMQAIARAHIRNLKDSDAEIRWAAADGLAAVGPDAAEAVPALQQALADPSADVRQAAARALGTIGYQAADASSDLERLAREDPEVRVQEAARWALTILRSFAAGPSAPPAAGLEEGIRFRMPLTKDVILVLEGHEVKINPVVEKAEDVARGQGTLGGALLYLSDQSGQVLFLTHSTLTKMIQFNDYSRFLRPRSPGIPHPSNRGGGFPVRLDRIGERKTLKTVYLFSPEAVERVRSYLAGGKPRGDPWYFLRGQAVILEATDIKTSRQLGGKKGFVAFGLGTPGRSALVRVNGKVVPPGSLQDLADGDRISLEIPSKPSPAAGMEEREEARGGAEGYEKVSIEEVPGLRERLIWGNRLEAYRGRLVRRVRDGRYFLVKSRSDVVEEGRSAWPDVNHPIREYVAAQVLRALRCNVCDVRIPDPATRGRLASMVEGSPDPDFLYLVDLSANYSLKDPAVFQKDPRKEHTRRIGAAMFIRLWDVHDNNASPIADSDVEMMFDAEQAFHPSLTDAESFMRQFIFNYFRLHTFLGAAASTRDEKLRPRPEPLRIDPFELRERIDTEELQAVVRDVASLNLEALQGTVTADLSRRFKHGQREWVASEVEPIFARLREWQKEYPQDAIRFFDMLSTGFEYRGVRVDIYLATEESREFLDAWRRQIHQELTQVARELAGGGPPAAGLEEVIRPVQLRGDTAPRFYVVRADLFSLLQPSGGEVPPALVVPPRESRFHPARGEDFLLPYGRVRSRLARAAADPGRFPGADELGRLLEAGGVILVNALEVRRLQPDQRGDVRLRDFLWEQGMRLALHRSVSVEGDPFWAEVGRALQRRGAGPLEELAGDPVQAVVQQLPVLLGAIGPGREKGVARFFEEAFPGLTGRQREVLQSHWSESWPSRKEVQAALDAAHALGEGAESYLERLQRQPPVRFTSEGGIVPPAPVGVAVPVEPAAAPGVPGPGAQPGPPVEGAWPHAALRGHTSGVRDVAFSPDGRKVASASADETVRIWDLSALAPSGPPASPPPAAGPSTSPGAGLEEEELLDHLIRQAIIAIHEEMGRQLSEEDLEVLKRFGLKRKDVMPLVRRFVKNKRRWEDTVEWIIEGVGNAKAHWRRLKEEKQKALAMPEPVVQWTYQGLLPALKRFTDSPDFSFLRSPPLSPPVQAEEWDRLIGQLEADAAPRERKTVSEQELGHLVRHLNEKWFVPNGWLLFRGFQVVKEDILPRLLIDSLVVAKVVEPSRRILLEGEEISIHFIRSPVSGVGAHWDWRLKQIIVVPGMLTGEQWAKLPDLRDIREAAQPLAEEAHQQLSAGIADRYRTFAGQGQALREAALYEEVRHALDSLRVGPEIGQAAITDPNQLRRIAEALLAPAAGEPPGILWQIWQDPLRDPRMAGRSADQARRMMMNSLQELSGQMTMAAAEPKFILRGWLSCVALRNQPGVSAAYPIVAIYGVRLLADQIGLTEGPRFSPSRWATGGVRFKDLFTMFLRLAQQPEERLRLAVKEVYGREFRFPVDEFPFAEVDGDGRSLPRPGGLTLGSPDANPPAAGLEEAVAGAEEGQARILEMPRDGIWVDGLTVRETGQYAGDDLAIHLRSAESALVVPVGGRPAVRQIFRHPGIRELQASLADEDIRVRDLPEDPDEAQKLLRREAGAGDVILLAPGAEVTDWVPAGSQTPVLVMPADVAAGLTAPELAALVAVAKAHGGILYIGQITRPSWEEPILILHSAA